MYKPMKEVVWKLWRNRWLRGGGVVFLLICDTRIETDPKAQPAVLLQM